METITLNRIDERGAVQLDALEDELLPLSASDEQVRSTLYLIDLLRSLSEQADLLSLQLPHVPDAAVRRHLVDAHGAISPVIGKTRELLFDRTKKLKSRRAVA